MGGAVSLEKASGNSGADAITSSAFTNNAALSSSGGLGGQGGSGRNGGAGGYGGYGSSAWGGTVPGRRQHRKLDADLQSHHRQSNHFWDWGPGG